MSRSRTIKAEDCDCEYTIEPSGREFWSKLCLAHGAEHRTLHEEAQRQHAEENRLRRLAEEFT